MRDHARPMTETELQSVVVNMARQKGWRVKTASQGSRSGKPARPPRNDGSNGFPDLVLARDTEVLFLECKAQDGKLSLDQCAWMIALPQYEVIRPSDLSRGRVDELLA